MPPPAVIVLLLICVLSIVITAGKTEARQPPTEFPENGEVALLANGSCIFFCNQGYQLLGVRVATNCSKQPEHQMPRCKLIKSTDSRTSTRRGKSLVRSTKAPGTGTATPDTCTDILVRSTLFALLIYLVLGGVVGLLLCVLSCIMLGCCVKKSKVGNQIKVISHANPVPKPQGVFTISNPQARFSMGSDSSNFYYEADPYSRSSVVYDDIISPRSKRKVDKCTVM